MDRTRLQYLFQLCIKNDATTEERQELLDLLMMAENEAIVKEMLHNTFETLTQTQAVSSETRASILSAIYYADPVEKNSRLFLSRIQILKWPSMPQLY